VAVATFHKGVPHGFMRQWSNGSQLIYAAEVSSGHNTGVCWKVINLNWLVWIVSPNINAGNNNQTCSFGNYPVEAQFATSVVSLYTYD
jgi:hypothetical protein